MVRRSARAASQRSGKRKRDDGDDEPVKKAKKGKNAKLGTVEEEGEEVRKDTNTVNNNNGQGANNIQQDGQQQAALDAPVGNAAPVAADAKALAKAIDSASEAGKTVQGELGQGVQAGPSMATPPPQIPTIIITNDRDEVAVVVDEPGPPARLTRARTRAASQAPGLLAPPTAAPLARKLRGKTQVPQQAPQLQSATPGVDADFLAEMAELEDNIMGEGENAEEQQPVVAGPSGGKGKERALPAEDVNAESASSTSTTTQPPARVTRAASKSDPTMAPPRHPGVRYAQPATPAEKKFNDFRTKRMWKYQEAVNKLNPPNHRKLLAPVVKALTRQAPATDEEAVASKTLENAIARATDMRGLPTVGVPAGERITLMPTQSAEDPVLFGPTPAGPHPLPPSNEPTDQTPAALEAARHGKETRRRRRLLKTLKEEGLATYSVAHSLGHLLAGAYFFGYEHTSIITKDRPLTFQEAIKKHKIRILGGDWLDAEALGEGIVVDANGKIVGTHKRVWMPLRNPKYKPEDGKELPKDPGIWCRYVALHDGLNSLDDVPVTEQMRTQLGQAYDHAEEMRIAQIKLTHVKKQKGGYCDANVAEETRTDLDRKEDMCMKTYHRLKRMQTQIELLAPEDQFQFIIPPGAGSDSWGGDTVHVVDTAIRNAFGRKPGNDMIAELSARPVKAIPIILERLWTHWEALKKQDLSTIRERIQWELDHRAWHSFALRIDEDAEKKRLEFSQQDFDDIAADDAERTPEQTVEWEADKARAQILVDESNGRGTIDTPSVFDEETMHGGMITDEMVEMARLSTEQRLKQLEEGKETDTNYPMPDDRNNSRRIYEERRVAEERDGYDVRQGMLPAWWHDPKNIRAVIPPFLGDRAAEESAQAAAGVVPDAKDAPATRPEAKKAAEGNSSAPVPVPATVETPEQKHARIKAEWEARQIEIQQYEAQGKYSSERNDAPPASGNSEDQAAGINNAIVIEDTASSSPPSGASTKPTVPSTPLATPQPNIRKTQPKVPSAPKKFKKSDIFKRDKSNLLLRAIKNQHKVVSAKNQEASNPQVAATNTIDTPATSEIPDNSSEGILDDSGSASANPSTEQGTSGVPASSSNVTGYLEAREDMMNQFLADRNSRETFQEWLSRHGSVDPLPMSGPSGEDAIQQDESGDVEMGEAEATQGTASITGEENMGEAEATQGTASITGEENAEMGEAEDTPRAASNTGDENVEMREAAATPGSTSNTGDENVEMGGTDTENQTSDATNTAERDSMIVVLHIGSQKPSGVPKAVLTTANPPRAIRTRAAHARMLESTQAQGQAAFQTLAASKTAATTSAPNKRTEKGESSKAIATRSSSKPAETAATRVSNPAAEMVVKAVNQGLLQAGLRASIQTLAQDGEQAQEGAASTPRTVQKSGWTPINAQVDGFTDVDYNDAATFFGDVDGADELGGDEAGIGDAQHNDNADSDYDAEEDDFEGQDDHDDQDGQDSDEDYDSDNDGGPPKGGAPVKKGKEKAKATATTKGKGKAHATAKGKGKAKVEDPESDTNDEELPACEKPKKLYKHLAIDPNEYDEQGNRLTDSNGNPVPYFRFMVGSHDADRLLIRKKLRRTLEERKPYEFPRTATMDFDDKEMIEDANKWRRQIMRRSYPEDRVYEHRDTYVDEECEFMREYVRQDIKKRGRETVASRPLWEKLFMAFKKQFPDSTRTKPAVTSWCGRDVDIAAQKGIPVKKSSSKTAKAKAADDEAADAKATIAGLSQPKVALEAVKGKKGKAATEAQATTAGPSAPARRGRKRKHAETVQEEPDSDDSNAYQQDTRQVDVLARRNVQIQPPAKRLRLRPGLEERIEAPPSSQAIAATSWPKFVLKLRVHDGSRGIVLSESTEPDHANGKLAQEDSSEKEQENGDSAENGGLDGGDELGEQEQEPQDDEVAEEGEVTEIPETPPPRKRKRQDDDDDSFHPGKRAKSNKGRKR
ncbi:uncharacterized protein BDZ99DRAFT_558059 [Mytilinidion resinicola]|uniref:Uncharacterized protein n=1 Tax=Mytilinidion resinicola TaxID=574789 RepID=A0A6A6YTS8_9PEZI|nr:uncharacterized protein BDZ99DRAFT_558059 [Mytilinidion resinicola]KAF2812210.1 hypothetical protein BDZ99DRAFT_558059 [Mytilinidion resinicola]